MPFCLDRKSTRLNSSHLVISYAVLLGSEEHTSELQSPCNLVCRLLLEKKKNDSRGGPLPWQPPPCVDLRSRRPSAAPVRPPDLFLFFFKGRGARGNPPSSPTRPSPD